MKNTLTDKIAKWTEELRAFGAHYDYDVSYLEALISASPRAFQAFEAGMSMGRYRDAAPIELLMIVKITGMQAEDCGPCTELNVKMAREAGVSESIIEGILRGGKGLTPEHLEVYQYARAVTTNEGMDPDLLPRLEKRWGNEVMGELALAIVSTRLYPTLKRALGYDKSCSLIPGLIP